MSEKKSMTKSTIPAINTGIVGFGFSGKISHAPFIAAHPAFRLHTIVSTGNEAAGLYPKAQIFTDFRALLNNPEIELVVICTPHSFHAAQAMQALKAGKHVVIEKPITMSAAELELLIETSTISGKKIFPYHNRRWDGDFLTLKHIIKQSFLGKVMEYESRFDRYSPAVSRAEWRYNHINGGGMLFDLGPHLIDQAVHLFGTPAGVWCMLQIQREGNVVNDCFDLKLIYPGMTATLKAGVFFAEAGPRFQVHGTTGSYIKYGVDPQEGMLKKGRKPMSKNFGVEPIKYSGLLHSRTSDKTIRVKYNSFPGNYMGFYDDVFESVRHQREPAITVADALLNLQIIEAAIKSHHEKRIIEIKE